MRFVGLRIGVAMDCKAKISKQTRQASQAIVILCLAWTAAGAAAQEAPPKTPVPTPEQMEQAQQLQKQGEEMGSWDQQYLIMDQATENVFERHGWKSESDEYARSLARDVGRIPFWQPQERQEVFMNSLQGRYQLTENQKTQLNGWVQHEAIMTTARHFKDLAPIAMEVVRARADGKPFTPEQVQKWSQKLEPLMGEALAATQRVTDKLKKTMTPEQQAKLDADIKALQRRHEDMVKDVQRWKEGKWTPMDWGLQNDPIHAQVLQKYADADANRTRLVEQTQVERPLDEGIAAADESAWDLYVKRFCLQFECTDEQRTKADAILKDSKREAIQYRQARKDRIEEAEESVRRAETPERKQAAQADLNKQLQQIEFIFGRMKKRLYAQVLTREQQARFPDVVKTAQTKPSE